jgi:hypothetical protein
MYVNDTVGKNQTNSNGCLYEVIWLSRARLIEEMREI